MTFTVSNPPTKPGIYYGLPDEVYRAIPCVSQSTLRDFMDCPRKWKLSPPKEVTPNMLWGSLVDAIWLSGNVSRYAIEPSVYLSKGMQCPQCKSVTDSQKCAKCKCPRVEVEVQKDWSNNSDTCRQWAEEQRAIGKEIVSSEAWVRAHAAVARLNSVEEIALQRSRCHVQVAVIGEIDDVMVKGLIDMVPFDQFRNALGDLKTAPSADPRDWPKYVFNNRLHIQAWIYLTLWNQQKGETLHNWYHFVVEQEAPHEPCYQPLSQEFLRLGERDTRDALALWKQCQEEKEFPGYPMNVVCEPENWMLRQ